MPFDYCRVRIGGPRLRFGLAGLQNYASNSLIITGLVVEKRQTYHNFFLELEVEAATLDLAEEKRKLRFRNIVNKWKKNGDVPDNAVAEYELLEKHKWKDIAVDDCFEVVCQRTCFQVNVGKMFEHVHM